jgi:coproporphyrinogen III oxidase
VLTDAFLIALKQRYLETIAQLNGGKIFEKKSWDFLTKAGKVEVNINRGDLFEKACVSTIHAIVTIPGRDYQSNIQWLGIQTFPSNPLVPMFMGVFEHVFEKGVEHCPGFFDVYPVIPYDEDREYFKKEIESVARKHGRTYEHLLQGYLKMFQLKEAGSGVGYGIGIAFGPEEENASYFQDAAEAIFKAYFHIVEKRKKEKPAPEQVETMFKNRAEWVKFTFTENRFYQGGVMLGVPPEAFMLHMLPPLVKF